MALHLHTLTNDELLRIAFRDHADDPMVQALADRLWESESNAIEVPTDAPAPDVRYLYVR